MFDTLGWPLFLEWAIDFGLPGVGSALKLSKAAVAKDLSAKARTAQKIFKKLRRPIPASEWEDVARRPVWRKTLDSADEDLGIALQAVIVSVKWIKNDMIGGAAAWVTWVTLHKSEVLQSLLTGKELPRQDTCQGALPGSDPETCASASTRLKPRLWLWGWLTAGALVVLALAGA